MTRAFDRILLLASQVLRLHAKAPSGPWTTEPHGRTVALYSGRDKNHHGLRLCNLADGDANAGATNELITQYRDLAPELAAALLNLAQAAETRYQPQTPLSPADVCPYALTTTDRVALFYTRADGSTGAVFDWPVDRARKATSLHQWFSAEVWDLLQPPDPGEAGGGDTAAIVRVEIVPSNAVLRPWALEPLGWTRRNNTGGFRRVVPDFLVQHAVCDPRPLEDQELRKSGWYLIVGASPQKVTR